MPEIPRGMRASLLGMLIIGMNATAQNYPNKPVRIVTTEPGGGTDFASRVIAHALPRVLGQQVIVENRAAIVSMETVAKAPADGYTLLTAASSLWLLPFLRQSVSWDPVRDFLPITLAVSSPNMITVHPSLPVKNTRELIALAKSKPGELNYGSSVGGSTHMAAELFKSMAGVNMLHIAYRGNGPALTAIISGQVHVMFPTFGAAMPHVKSGRLRALAVTSAQPSALLPGVPTVAATVPGYESTVIYGVFAPAGTPAPIIMRLHEEIVRVLNTPDVKQQFFNAGIEIVGSSPEELAALIKADMNKMGKVIRDAGIRDG